VAKGQGASGTRAILNKLLNDQRRVPMMPRSSSTLSTLPVGVRSPITGPAHTRHFGSPASASYAACFTSPNTG